MLYVISGVDSGNATSGRFTDLMSIGLFVAASRTISLMQGGGVIGLRSCT